MTVYVYIITNLINGKVYIGKSRNPKKRWSQHVRGDASNISLINRSIKKYSKENFSFDMIDQSDDVFKASKLEEFYTYAANSYDREFGYNLYIGTKCPKNHCHDKCFHFNAPINDITIPYRKGSSNGMAAINESIAIEIYNKYKLGNISCLELEKQYGISDSTVNNILKGKGWKHLDLKPLVINNGKNFSNKMKGEKNIKAKLSELDILNIRKYYDLGNITYNDLSKIYNVSPGQIYKIVKRIMWKNVL